MNHAQQNPFDVFSNLLKTAALLIAQNQTAPFERGANFHLIGPDGQKHQFTHSAESLREARNTLQSLGRVQGGEHVEQTSAQPVQNSVRVDTGITRG
ncbi:MAG: hypothetical protein C0436_05680 [Alphaproteobacteria bacterium]|nr:hypothetical protein [Alphaproteobacteria bacterium]